MSEKPKPAPELPAELIGSYSTWKKKDGSGEDSNHHTYLIDENGKKHVISRQNFKDAYESKSVDTGHTSEQSTPHQVGQEPEVAEIPVVPAIKDGTDNGEDIPKDPHQTPHDSDIPPKTQDDEVVATEQPIRLDIENVRRVVEEEIAKRDEESLKITLSNILELYEKSINRTGRTNETEILKGLWVDALTVYESLVEDKNATEHSTDLGPPSDLPTVPDAGTSSQEEQVPGVTMLPIVSAPDNDASNEENVFTDTPQTTEDSGTMPAAGVDTAPSNPTDSENVNDPELMMIGAVQPLTTMGELLLRMLREQKEQEDSPIDNNFSDNLVDPVLGITVAGDVIDVPFRSLPKKEKLRPRLAKSARRVGAVALVALVMLRVGDKVDSLTTSNDNATHSSDPGIIVENQELTPTPLFTYAPTAVQSTSTSEVIPTDTMQSIAESTVPPIVLVPTEAPVITPTPTIEQASESAPTATPQSASQPIEAMPTGAPSIEQADSSRDTEPTSTNGTIVPGGIDASASPAESPTQTIELTPDILVVHKGDGFTNLIQQTRPALDDKQSYALYKYLVDKFGGADNLIESEDVSVYPLLNSNGDYGLVGTGFAIWANGVQEAIYNWTP